MKVELRVGRGRNERPPLVWEVPDDSDQDELAEDIYDHSLPFLRSRDVEAFWDPQTRTGKVYAGFHCVGEARIVQEAVR